MANKANRKVKVSLKDLKEAGTATGVTPPLTEQQAEQIFAKLEERSGSEFSLATVAAYLSATLVICGAIALIGQIAIPNSYGAALLISLFLSGGFLFTGARLRKNKDMRTLCGVMYWLTAAMTPVTVGIVLKMYTDSADQNMGTLIMSGATVAVGLWLTSKSKISFVITPALVAGLVFATTASHMLVVNHASTWYSDWTLTENWAVILYGLGASALGFWVDEGKNVDEDYAYWVYTVAALSLFFGATFLDKGNSGYWIYGLLGLVTAVAGVVINRGIYAFVGGAAVFVCMGHFLWDIFGQDVTSASLVVLAVGTLVGLFSFWYRKNQASLEKAIMALVPDTIKKALPPR